MTTFLRLLEEADKAGGLLGAVGRVRAGDPGPLTFTVRPEGFREIPGAPFAYWVGE